MKSLLAAGGIGLLGSAGYAYRSIFIEISREKLDLTDPIRRLRIVAVSDVHASSFYGSMEKLIELINRESPDVFVLTGDIIDRRGNEGVVRAFKSVKAPLAKLATLGNWEYRGRVDLATLKKEYEKAGFNLLVNETVEISGLVIVGLDDFLHGSPAYQILKRTTISSPPLLLLSHCPESFDFVSAISPNPVIAISGHTHGGQIAPFGLVYYLPPGSGSYLQGWYHRGKHSMYVMRGVGTTVIPLRIGARPEILVLDL